MTSEGGLTHSNPDVVNLDFRDSINEEGSIARRGLESAKKNPAAEKKYCGWEEPAI